MTTKHPSFPRIAAAAAALALIMPVQGCKNDTVKIPEQRVVQQQGPARTQEVSTAERFGYRPRAAHAPQEAATPSYRWTAPAEWQEEAPAPLRPANFSAGDDGSVEIYLSVLGGTGGGLEPNVNRWRSQMALPPLSGEEVASLPTATVLDQEAVLIDFEGHYGGMSGEADVAAARMLGAILFDGDSAVFVKMVGPSDTVANEEEHFKTFLASLERAGTQTAYAGHSHGGGEWQHPPIESADGWVHPPIDGAGGGFVHPPMDGAGGGFVHPPIPEGSAILSDSSFESERPGGLRWQAPEAWRKGPDRPVRLVTYLTGPSQEVETYVTILTGTAGGVGANVNRWREEMGQGRLSASEVADLPALDVLGHKATLIEVAGHYAGKTGANLEAAKMLGLIVPMETQVLFVRMTGPQELVQSERDNFVRFCQSLQLVEEAR